MTPEERDRRILWTLDDLGGSGSSSSVQGMLLPGAWMDILWTLDFGVIERERGGE
jgi:hypothetical protein